MLAKLTKRLVDSLVPAEVAFECRDSEIKGFLLRIQPSGRRAWYYQYRRPDGRQTRYRLGSYPGLSPEGARSIALERAAEACRGIDLVARKRADRAEGVRARHRTLRRFLDDCYEPWARTHLKSFNAHLRRIRSDFAEWLDRPMDEISPLAIEQLRSRWRKGGTQPVTINRDMQRLQAVLSRAVSTGVIARHPFQSIKPLPHDRTGRVRYLTATEEGRLRAALTERENEHRRARIRYNTWRIERHLAALPERTRAMVDSLRPMVLLALNTGLRRGELFSLRWVDVNLEARIVTVVSASAKTGQTRRVPLNTEATAILKYWQTQCASTDALVFPGKNGSRLDNINKAWHSVAKSAGLLDFRFHDLRHTFASRRVQAGVDLNAVRELLGHTGIEMTLRYSHLGPEHLRAAVEKVAG